MSKERVQLNKIPDDKDYLFNEYAILYWILDDFNVDVTKLFINCEDKLCKILRYIVD